MGAGGRARRQHAGAEAGVRAGEGGGRKTGEDGRQDRQRRRQSQLPENRRSLSRQARQGPWSACREDQGSDQGDQLNRNPSSRRTPGPIRRGLSDEARKSPTSFDNKRRWLWVPAFAGTIRET